MSLGSSGDAVRDLQRRLVIAGHLVAGSAASGYYCVATEHAVLSFQRARGLRAHGRCDEATWSTLVEASWSLGDRLLFLASPHLRGDDVVELQNLLTRLGFDCGRIDGIYGPDTTSAVAEFQSNSGLLVDGACGRDTVVALTRLSRHTGAGPGIATVREAESLRQAGRSLHQRRIVLGHFGGVAPLVRALARVMRHAGAEVITLHDPDAHTQALAANRFEAHLYLGLEAQATNGLEVAYYSVPSFSSPGGQSLAEQLARQLTDDPLLPTWPLHLVGMRLPVLRETRMVALMLTLGPVRDIVDHAAALASSLATGVEHWLRSPQD